MEVAIVKDRIVAGDFLQDHVVPLIGARDRLAFDRLVTPLIEPGYRLAYAMLRQREAAQDVVQEASLKAWRKFAEFRNERGGFRAWYFTIVANECRSLRRGRWWSVLRLPEVRQPQGSGDTAMTASELRQSIARLNHADRVMLYLFYWLDLPLEEVAVVVGVSAAAAKARLYRAVGRLRLQLDPNQEISE
jgi:RNA polymerase sigma-70 factor, ECF subfamily